MTSKHPKTNTSSSQRELTAVLVLIAVIIAVGALVSLSRKFKEDDNEEEEGFKKRLANLDMKHKEEYKRLQACCTGRHP